LHAARRRPSARNLPARRASGRSWSPDTSGPRLRVHVPDDGSGLRSPAFRAAVQTVCKTAQAPRNGRRDRAPQADFGPPIALFGLSSRSLWPARAPCILTMRGRLPRTCQARTVPVRARCLGKRILSRNNVKDHHDGQEFQA
jgi:hypothetical protein